MSTLLQLRTAALRLLSPIWVRALLAVIFLLVVAVAAAWMNRANIILYLASGTDQLDVTEYQPVEWMRGPEQASARRPDSPPNIVFILADDLGLNDISTFGGGVAGGRVPTPNIDRLAAQGAIFTNAYAGAATCAPSRAMLLTGRYATRTGFEFTPAPTGMGRILSILDDGGLEVSGLPGLVWNEAFDETGLSYGEMGLPPEEVTIAEILNQADYHSVHIGKWHLGRGTEMRAVSQGFDESLLMASGLYLPEDSPDVVNARLHDDIFDRFLWSRMQFAADYDRAGEVPVDEAFEPSRYITDYYTDAAVEVIEANRNRPFFLYLAHWGLHNPLQATREDYEAVGDIEPHRLRVYAAMVRSIDRSVGRVMDALEEQGIADNTILVFTSDNGGASYIGLPEVNAPYRGWKTTLFEGGIRVPMFVRWPNRIAPGRVVDEPVAFIDLMPSFAAAAGVALPGDIEIDGQDILPLALGEADSVSRPDDAIYWSSGFYRAVRAGDWKLQVNERQGRQWLFNLAEDPTESTNLAESRPEVVARLRGLIDAHWSQARDPLYPHAIEWPVLVDKTTFEPIDEGDEYVIWAN
ncbi:MULTISPECIES: sulfatase [Hyphobacterium]|uniref:Sulfatase n=1 Tax=Hyphobacterium vulgare TaxID=1736751 RepID=A0ABV7A0N0_9PROT